ncbi:MAG: LysR family transcriptional regulator, partial [Pseudomonadota bacterium]
AGNSIALARAPASDALQALYGLTPPPTRLETTGSHSYYLSYPVLSGLSPAASAFRKWLLDEIRPDDPASDP